MQIPYANLPSYCAGISKQVDATVSTWHWLGQSLCLPQENTRFSWKKCHKYIGHLHNKMRTGVWKQLSNTNFIRIRYRLLMPTVTSRLQDFCWPNYRESAEHQLLLSLYAGFQLKKELISKSLRYRIECAVHLHQTTWPAEQSSVRSCYKVVTLKLVFKACRSITWARTCMWHLSLKYCSTRSV